MADDPILLALETLMGGQTQMRGELADLRSELSDLRSEVSELRGGQSELRGELTQLRGEQTRLRVDVLDQLEKMENKLTLIREDIAVNMGRADAAHRAADNTRDELRALNAQVQAMERRQRMMNARLDQLEK